MQIERESGALLKRETPAISGGHGPVRSRGRRFVSAPLALSLLGVCAIGIGCAHRASTGPAERGSAAPAEGTASFAAFAANARLMIEEESRRFKLRSYMAPPDRLRVEMRGPIGGLLLIVTALEGRVRLVVPSKRRYSETTLERDVGSALLGVPLSGCDLGKTIRFAANARWYDPCGTTQSWPADPSALGLSPLVIQSISSGTNDRVEFNFGGRREDGYPSSVVIGWGEGSAQLWVDAFRHLDPPRSIGADFFWEPVPPGFAQVPLEALVGEEGQ